MNREELISRVRALPFPREDFWVITGGAMVYAQALDLCEKLYITEIDAEFEGDTWFPEFDRDKYIRQVDSLQDGPVPYAYVTYTHK